MNPLSVFSKGKGLKMNFKYNLSGIQERKMLIIALVDAILAGFYLKIFPFDYTINLAVVALPIYYFLDRRLHPVLTAVHIAIIGLVFRTVTGSYYYGSFLNAFWADFNFLYFDLTYGLIFTVFFYNKSSKSLYTLFWAAMAGDFFGNAAEFISRFGINAYLTSNVMATLLAVALTRAVVAVLLISSIQYYNSFLRKQEHDQRYQRQIELISQLRGEIFFLKKNMDHVEQVMDESFSLYREFDELKADEMKSKALSIAKNVHEVKKNYFRAVEGIDEIIHNEISEDLIELSDIVKILQMSTQRILERTQAPINLKFSIDENVRINAHSMLMSVLKNLVTNAIESIENEGEVTLTHKSDGLNHFFSVSDTGSGISEENIAYIFRPGYSTKYDLKTGNSSRGIGLTLVKDIVENHFNGEITVTSKPGSGTEFCISVPKENI
jgi:two-component system sensor histidine kinase YcbA